MILRSKGPYNVNFYLFRELEGTYFQIEIHFTFHIVALNDMRWLEREPFSSKEFIFTSPYPEVKTCLIPVNIPRLKSNLRFAISSKFLQNISFERQIFSLSIAFRNTDSRSGQQPLFKRKHCDVLPINL